MSKYEKNTVLYYQHLQFTGAEIGLLTGITPLVYLISTPLFTGIADSTRMHRQIMTICIILFIVLLAIFPAVITFAPVFLLVILMYAVAGPITPFADSATLHMLGDEKDMYGRIRLGGTIGYGVAAAIAGAVVENFGLRAAFWGGALLLLAPLLLSQKFAYKRAESSSSTWASIRDLLQSLIWLRFLLIAFIFGVALAVANIYFFPYMKQIGVPESMMGIALTIGTLVEIPILFFGNRLLAKINPYRLMILALVFTGLRLLLFSSVTTLWLILLIQLLNGLTFVPMILGGVAYANQHAPENLNATAQGLFATMNYGVGAAVGGFLGGYLLEHMSIQNVFLVMSVPVFVAILVITTLSHFIPQQKIKQA